MTVILGRGGALKTTEMRLTAHLLLLFITAGLRSTYGQRDIDVDHNERHINVSANNNHTWGSDAALRFTSAYEDGHIVLTITTETQHTGNCSDKNAIITIKEATDATGQLLCGDGVYESPGRVVTAVVTGLQDVRISYILRPALYQCNTTFPASQATSILRSADIFRQNGSSLFKGTCRWTIYSRPGYNVRVQLLESNITSPCSENKISVDIDDQVTLSWCGNDSSSYTSYHSELVIWFNMSSIVDGHGFTINYTEVQDLSPGFISNCRSSLPVAYLPRTLTFNLNVTSDQNSREYKEGERHCYLLLHTYDSHVLVTVLQSSLPSTCSNDTVQVVEGPYLRTSWCEHSTPSVQSMGTFLTIKFNASSVTSGSVTIQYRTVRKSWNTTRPCYLNYNTQIKSIWSWWGCRSYLPATSLMQTFTVTNDDFFTVYPYFPRMTREWRIQSYIRRYVYTEIETNPGLRCSHGVIQVYYCDVFGYKYLGSWCDGRANYTFSSTSCMAVLFNATHLYGGSNAIFSLKYKEVDQLPSGTTTRPSTISWPSMTSSPAQPACSEVTRSVTSGVHSRVLVIPALARVTCRWRVTTSVLADSENQIELNLESVASDITSSDMCYGRYLEVFDGPSSSSPFLARWCGQSSQTLVSTGQVMFLVYTGGSSYQWLPWSVHYKTIVSDSVLDVVSQRSSRSNKTGAIVGSVFGVVVLVLAAAGALIAWRMYSRKQMSPYQNHDISHHSEARSSVFTVTPPSFSNAVYEEVKSPEICKEAAKAPCNPYDTPNTNEQPECHRNQYLSLYQPLDPRFPKGNVEDNSATYMYDNNVRGGKGDPEI